VDRDKRGGCVILAREDFQDAQLLIAFLQVLVRGQQVLLQRLVLFLQGKPVYDREVLVLRAQLLPRLVPPLQCLEP
jgi:hypothetical protein